jgi:hypothetical protein
MRKALFGLATLALVATTATAQVENASIWSHQLGNDAAVDSGWVVSIPALTSDSFSAAYNVTAGLADNDDRQQINGNMNVNGVGISVADFGTTQTFETIGVFRPNLPLDPTGLTPNLATPIATSGASITTGTPLFTFQFFGTTADGDIPTGDTTAVASVEFPVGDPGLLGVGSDSTASGTGNCGFTQDNYATPTIVASFIDMGINIGQDNTNTSSCKQSARLPHGRLRCQTIGSAGGGTSVTQGDKLACTVRATDTLNMAFFGTKPGSSDKISFKFYFAGLGGPGCSPSTGLGPVLPAISDGDSDNRGVFLRINAPFPSGFAGNTFKFAAVWGNNPSTCLSPGVGFTNCVSIAIGDDPPPPPPFGQCDDGTVETGWVVTIPSLTSDYFNNSNGPAPGGFPGSANYAISVLDFLTAVPAYPTSGFSNPNLGVDASGNTPDVAGAGVIVTVSPFTFPAGTFATTSGAYVVQPAAAGGGAFSGISIHAWVQFPPGDPGLLGVGGDTTLPQGCSYFTQDAYTSPAIFFGSIANWGLRIQ